MHLSTCPPRTSESATPLGIAERWAIAYLAFPVLIFLVGWFQPLFGLALAGLLLWGLKPLVVARPEHGRRVMWTMAAAAWLAGFAWASLGGAGHLFYANDDWRVRDAVLHDLVVASWPVGYGVQEGVELVLRCPVAYYLPAAAFGKVFGVAAADAFLFIWTGVGASLFLWLCLRETPSWRAFATTLAVIVFFSGMDIVGTALRGPPFPEIAGHLEWWAGLFQYSSNTTQLFWVPNHALPGWLAAALLWRHWRNPALLVHLPMLMAVVVLWSPLTMLGLVPFVAIMAIHHILRGTGKAILSIPAVAPGLAVFLTNAIYLTLDTAGIPSGLAVELTPARSAWVIVYGAFILLEFGVLSLLLLLIRRDSLILCAAATLILLPLYSFGPSNDLVMRASIPALSILAIASAKSLAEGDWSRHKQVLLSISVVLIIGAVTPFNEFARVFVFPGWQPNRASTLIEATHSLPPHYVGKLNRPILAWALRQPHRIRPGKTPAPMESAQP